MSGDVYGLGLRSHQLVPLVKVRRRSLAHMMRRESWRGKRKCLPSKSGAPACASQQASPGRDRQGTLTGQLKQTSICSRWHDCSQRRKPRRLETCSLWRTLQEQRKTPLKTLQCDTPPFLPFFFSVFPDPHKLCQTWLPSVSLEILRGGRNDCVILTPNKCSACSLSATGGEHASKTNRLSVRHAAGTMASSRSR